jgi:hypothetical protein
MTLTKILPSGQLLDTSTATEITDKTSYELSEILAIMGLPPSMKTFDTLAGDLSALARRAKPWTKKYVHSVYRRHIAPSPEFAAAVEKLVQAASGAPAGVAGAAYVRVLADPRQVPEGVLIPAAARVIKCARPGCHVWFVRIHPRQKYHDPDCRA